MPKMSSWFVRRLFSCPAFCLFLPCIWIVTLSVHAQTPEWIWHPNDGKAPGKDETRYFKKTITIDKPVAKATLTATADDDFKLEINGKTTLSGNTWERGFSANVTKALKAGENTILAIAHNNDSAAGFIAVLQVHYQDGSTSVVVSDKSWQASEGKDPAGSWVAAKSLGEVGVDPWGDVFRHPEATPTSSIKVAEGFKIELLRSAAAEEGSWVCMTIDSKGRLIISPQDGQLWRATVPGTVRHHL